VNIRRLKKVEGILLAAAMRHKSRGKKATAFYDIIHRVYCKSTIDPVQGRASREQNNFGKCWVAA
jgi:hypothetical protein